MKTSTIRMIAVFAAAILLSANVALAKNNGGGGGGGGNNGGNHNNGGFKFSLGGNSQHHDNFKTFNKFHNDHCYPKYYNYSYRPYGSYPYTQTYVQPYPVAIVAGQAFEPFHSTYIVLPGDSFYVVSLKEYGTSSVAMSIAQFNGLPQSAALVPGQRLMLPSVSANGSLRPSGAPIADEGFAPQGPITQQFATSGSAPATSNISTVKPAVEEARPKVTVGSTLLVDGQTFGDKQGVARLRVSGLSLPIEVIEWTTSSVKIRLPQVELTSSTKADIEVLRADGTLASKTAVELGAASESLALGK